MTGRRAGLLRTLGLDLVGPLLLFRVLVGAGLTEVWALVLSGTLPAIGVAFDWFRWHTLEVVGALVLGGIALSVVLAVVSNHTKVVLLEGAAVTAGFGIVCLVSLMRRRPLIFYFAQAFSGGRHSDEGIEMDADYEEYSEARRYWRIVTSVWGIVYLVEAAVRAAIVQTLSTGTALAVNRIAPWVILGLLMAWTLWWGMRLRGQKPQDPVAADNAEG